MQLTNYVAHVWNAATSMPTPAQVQQEMLRKAQLEYLKACADAEDHRVHMEAHTRLAVMLRDRINRLSLSEVLA